jgi:hypothetical protein
MLIATTVNIRYRRAFFCFALSMSTFCMFTNNHTVCFRRRRLLKVRNKCNLVFIKMQPNLQWRARVPELDISVAAVTCRSL